MPKKKSDAKKMRQEKHSFHEGKKILGIRKNSVSRNLIRLRDSCPAVLAVKSRYQNSLLLDKRTQFQGNFDVECTAPEYPQQAFVRPGAAG